MFETVALLSLNSHSDVLKLTLIGVSLSEGLQKFQEDLNTKEIPIPQLLATESTASSPLNSPSEEYIYITGPQEVLSSIKKEIKNFPLSKDSFCTVTATCTGVSTPEIASLITKKLSACEIKPLRLWMSGMSCTLLLPASQRQKALTELHSLIQE